jgi:hypothetical protein
MASTYRKPIEDIADPVEVRLAENSFSETVSYYLDRAGDLQSLANVVGYPTGFIEIWLKGDLSPIPCEQERLTNLLEERFP